MEVAYFSRWLWAEGHGIDQLSARRVATVHRKGNTYIAFLSRHDLVLTLRPETSFIDLGFVDPEGRRLGGASFIVSGPWLEAIDIWHGAEEFLRIQRDSGSGDELRLWHGPDMAVSSFRAKPAPKLEFPRLGDYQALTGLSRDPWNYLELPTGFNPPAPT